LLLGALAGNKGHYYFDKPNTQQAGYQQRFDSLGTTPINSGIGKAMPFPSIVTPCYNEEKNVEEHYRQVREVFATIPDYSYEHIFMVSEPGL